MHAIGSPVHRRLVTVYTISAAIAGVAGALFTQTNAYRDVDRVRLRQFGQGDGDADPRRHRPALRRLCRRRRLHGAGGLFLQALARPSGNSASGFCWCWRCCLRAAACSGWSSRPAAICRGRQAVSAAALQVERLNRSFGALHGDARRQPHARARRAPRADRPERRRQDHAGQSDHRRAPAVVRAACCSTARTSPRPARPSGRGAGSRAPSRSTSCSAG